MGYVPFALKQEIHITCLLPVFPFIECYLGFLVFRWLFYFECVYFSLFNPCINLLINVCFLTNLPFYSYVPLENKFLYFYDADTDNKFLNS